MTLSKCYKHNFTAARILLPTRCAWRDVARGYVMVLSNEKAENGCVLRNSFHPLGVACLRGRGTWIFQHPFKQHTETSQALWLSLRGPLLFFCRDSGNLKPFAFLHLKTWRTEAWLAAQMGRVICEFGVLRNFQDNPQTAGTPKVSSVGFLQLLTLHGFQLPATRGRKSNHQSYSRCFLPAFVASTPENPK